ncbi:hypothetical protein Poli38472_000192 [Pythium oligandrum]|uniref:Uncharacterized protein n=1 Tax=Pythium oligandrum TaxID=41045 RepID=A0A8K1FE51_PYTOL|nr:hypothetical protein Poli38472_000192 [Pythium oligandrum]|eukprot:TMW60150.1 hypothetical protein Poli38472_000192 [Pythium oligandrum]
MIKSLASLAVALAALHHGISAQETSSFCPPNMSEMSVEGINGVFCVIKGHECVANIKGDCPTKQLGLDYGSYCGTVASGVFGCKVLTAESIPTYQPTFAPSKRCADSEVEVSVEGVQNSYCVDASYVCTAARDDGNCPGPQPGLPDGSFCDIVASGVYGCKAFNGTEPTEYEPEAPRNCTGSIYGDEPVSVEGVGTFCASGDICSGDRYGSCPAAQDGLDADSRCVIVSTGVFGCAL